MIICENCFHHENNGPWWRWVCKKAPKETPRQFVVADPWLTESPFEKCKDINPSGDCDMFEQASEDKLKSERAR